MLKDFDGNFECKFYTFIIAAAPSEFYVKLER
jgi:hypothetical protein